MEFDLHIAKVYLGQAQATKWRHWKFWLLDVAAKRRKSYLDFLKSKNKPVEHGQLNLF